MPVYKDVGTGSWTLSGDNTFSGATTVSAGSLAVAGASGSINDSSALAVSSGAALVLTNAATANHADRLGDAAAVTLTGGTFVFANDGGEASFSEAAGTLTLPSGLSTVYAAQAAEGQTSALTFAGLSRTAGSMNFVGSGLGASDRNRIFITGQPDGAIGAWATVNGSLPAFYSSTLGVYGSIPTEIAAKGAVIVSNDTSDVIITTEGTFGANTLSGDVAIINSLTQNTAYDSVVDTAGKTLRLDAASIIAGQAALTLGAAPNDGALAPRTDGGIVGLVNNGAGALTVNALVTDGALPSGLSAGGSGVVVLAATNTFSGTVSASLGNPRLANSLALQNAVLASGDLSFDSAVASHTFTLGNITNAFSQPLVDTAAHAVTLAVGNNNADSAYGGGLSGIGTLVKTGAGTLALTGANTHSGGTAVASGTLVAAHNAALGTGPVTVDGTLNLTVANTTYSGLSTSLSGAGTVNVALGTGSNSSPLNGDASGFTGVWNLGTAGSGGKAQMNGADNADATVNVLSNATLYVSAAGTHSAAAVLNGGDMGEAYGQLRLEGFSEWAGPVTLAGDVFGSGDGFFGANSGTGTISGVISDLGGAHEVNKVGGGTTVFSAPNNTYAGLTWVRAGTLAAASLKNVGAASSLGQPADAASGTIKLGTGTTAARLTYVGTGDTTDRIIDLAGTTGGAYLDMSGSGTLTFTSDPTYSGDGSKTLYLQGSTDGVGKLEGVFANGTAATNKLIKSGTGTWILANANTHSGETEVQAGTLSLTHPNAIPLASLVRFSGRDGVLAFDHDGAGETELNITIGVGNSGTLASGAGAGGAAVTHNVNDLSLSQVTVTVCRSSSVLSGSPAVYARTVNLSGGNVYTTTLYPTDADLLVGSAAILANSQTKTLRLDGTSAGSSVTGAIYNGLNTLTLHKASPGTWTLTGSNSYSGATVVYGGTLDVSGAGGKIANSSGFTVNSGGTLRLSSTPAANNANRLADTKALNLNGGTLDFSHTAGAADYSETVGAVTAGAAGSAIAASQAAVAQTSALTLTSLARSGNGTLDFSGAGLGVDARNRILIGGQPDGLIGFWATYNGGGLAGYDSAKGVYAGSSSESLIAARGPASEIPDNAAAFARITETGTAGVVTLQGLSVNSVAALRQDVDTPAVIDTAAKTLATHVVGISAGQAALTLGASAGDGALTALATGGKLELANDSASALTVNAAVSNNAGAVSLAKTGLGDVTIAGATLYTGGTAINTGTLAFVSHIVPQTLAGVVSGGGSLVKDGTNELHLMAANTYTGPTTINAGIVRPDQNAAFGTSAGGVFIADGATLDVGCTPDVGGTRGTNALNMGSEVFTVTGAGVDGLGALVNNSAVSQNSAVSKVVLAGDTVVGGTQAGGRIDIRNNTPTLTMNDHTLTKKGPNTFGITSATVTPGAGHIDTEQGFLRLESSTKLNGSSANTVTIRSGAELELYRVTNPQDWHLILENNTTFDAANSSDASTQNRWAGPVTLGGAVTLTGGSGYVANLLGEIDGSGPLTKTGAASITLSGTNSTYTGATLITAGTLSVSNLASVGQACSLGRPANAADGTVKIGSGTTAATLTYLGAGDVSDRVLDLAGTTGGATLYHNGTGPLTLSGGCSASGSGSKTLTLRGTSAAAAEISGPIVNPASGRVAIQKSDADTWVLSGNNSYTGDVTVSNGKLILSGANAQGFGALIVGNATADAVTRLAAGCQLTSSGTRQRAGGIMVGAASGAYGALYMSAGATVSRTPGTGDDSAFTVGRSAGSYGYFNMSGGDFRITRIQTGLSSSTSTSNTVGNVRITGGVLAIRDYLLLARGKGSVTAFTLDGGTLYHTNTTERFSIGYEGGRADVNLLGGSLLSTTNITVRQSAANPTGIVNLCAGTLSANHFENTAPGVALLNFAGGTFKTSPHTAVTVVPASMTGVYSYGAFGAFAGGAIIDTAGRSCTVAAPVRAPAGNGVTSIALADKGSGYIGEPYVSVEGDGLGACAVANMEDDGAGNGTYRVASVTVTCPGVNYTAATIVFNGGGRTAAVPTVASVTLSPNTSGGLTKQGAGTLTLGAANTYAGATTVAAGTLKLGAAGALPTGTAVTLAGGTLDLSGYTVTNAVSGSGTLANGTLRATLSPAGEGAIGNDAVTLSSAMLSGGTYLADVTPAGASDLVAVSGSINLSAFDLVVVDPDQLDRHQIYTLLTCSGTRSGTFASDNLPGDRWHLSYQADGSVKLIYSAGTLIRVR